MYSFYFSQFHITCSSVQNLFTLVQTSLYMFTSAVWDQHTKVRISQIEQVQRRAARWTVSNFDRQASVTQIVRDLWWRTLEQRRVRLCLFYKVIHGLVAVPLPVQYSNRISRYCHSMTFRQVYTSRDYDKYPPINIVSKAQDANFNVSEYLSCLSGPPVDFSGNGPFGGLYLVDLLMG